MTSALKSFAANEPLRARVYGALVALLPLLAAFGVPLTEPQTAGILGFAYAVLIGGTEWSRTRVTPVR